MPEHVDVVALHSVFILNFHQSRMLGVTQTIRDAQNKPVWRELTCVART